jgi:hypothetical protein
MLQQLIHLVMSEKRFTISILVIIASLTLLLIPLWFADVQNWETAFTAVVGLVGTWVGTVLAFYFSKENFDAASASTQKLVDSITSKEKLSTTFVEGVMISVKIMASLALKTKGQESNINLIDMKGTYFKDKNRLPILDAKGCILFIVHQSLIDNFLVDKATEGVEVKTITLKDALDNYAFKEQAKKFATIKSSDSLQRAKILMEGLSTAESLCSDIFVTIDGTKNTKVIGWITDKVIQKNSIV